ncbi:GNAT family N-acetyltransferase [Mycobacterium sp. pUA109]|uniref:GNAT family N-acetyltransferase n=1 Tax=Mycobacterium sp. pUA109 TaxID=3238982 RepID=UPI00351B1D97
MQLPPEPELSDGPDLLLRRYRPMDLGGVMAQCQDPEFQRWTLIPVPYTESDAAEFLSAVAEGWRAGTCATWAVVHQGRYAGCVDLRLDGVDGAELGFGLGPWARGAGVMTRALRLALAWAFDELNLKVVHWRATVGNWPARGAVARCGFKVEGTVRGLIAQRGKRRDGWIGSVRRGDVLTAGPRRVRAGAISAIRAERASHPDPRVVTIRDAVEADLDAVLAVAASGTGDHSAYLRGEFGNSRVLLAVDGSTIAGFLVWNRGLVTVPFVSLVVVAAAYRRRGVASQLFDAVEKDCPGRRLLTSTKLSNECMQRFLEHRGYRRSGELALDSRDPDVFYRLARGDGAAA